MLDFVSSRFMAVAFAAIGFFLAPSASPVEAAPIALPFDYTTNDENVVGTVSGTAGDLFFRLKIDDLAAADAASSNVNGSFVMKLVGPDGLTWAGYVEMMGKVAQNVADGFIPPDGANDLGDVFFWSFGYLGLDNTWFLHVESLDLPLTIIVNSVLNNSTDDNPSAPLPFTALLTVEVGQGGDLQIATTPIPASLALFTTGLGLFGLMQARRRKVRGPVG